ncbi:MAG: hypothetical protein LBU11_13340, partial [Zoogloeaceae bacterium]|nr:hypothetical protein [Zoogloeaceae bacterium]
VQAFLPMPCFSFPFHPSGVPPLSAMTRSTARFAPVYPGQSRKIGSMICGSVAFIFVVVITIFHARRQPSRKQKARVIRQSGNP